MAEAHLPVIDQSLADLSDSSSRIIDAVYNLGERVPYDTPLGDALLSMMSAVLQLDQKLGETRSALAHIGTELASGNRRQLREEQKELLRLRRAEVERGERTRELMGRITDLEELNRSLHELNNMLLSNRARSSPPSSSSSGFCSSSHSPRSVEERETISTVPSPVAEVDEPNSDESIEQMPSDTFTNVPKTESIPDEPTQQAPFQNVQDETIPEEPLEQAPTKRSPLIRSMTFTTGKRVSDQAPPKPQRKLVLDFLLRKQELELERAALSRLRIASAPTVDDANQPTDVEDSTHSATAKQGDKSVYTTPMTSRKSKMRRRSSSISETMRKYFTPKRKVKTPIPEVVDQ